MEGESEAPQRPGGPASAARGLRHQALIWRDGADWAAVAAAFIQDGVRRGELALAAVPVSAGAMVGKMLDGGSFDFFDMTELGRNPARIIAAMLDFARIHAGTPLRYVCQPFWAGRPDAENSEAARHEALVNLALADVSATVLCVYDARELDTAALSCAEETHPVVITEGRSRASQRYAGPGIVPARCDHPLPPPPPSALSLRFRNDLRAVRQHVTSAARQAGLSGGRAADLALAASEVAANTLRHAGGGGMLHLWPTADEIICQIMDSGRIDDPLAGRRRPAEDGSGHGLWVVNQVCDLVQLRSGRAGTMVRMHMRRPQPQAQRGLSALA